MTAEVISIGDELLIGQVVNTNATWLGSRFADLGIHVDRVTAIGDDRAGIAFEVGAACSRADIVVITGGLGPTHDDVTKVAVADHFGVELEFQEDLFQALRARYERAGLVMSGSNRTQAEVPAGFEVLANRWGSAPGLRRTGADCTVVILPGVPREMRGLMEQHVLPGLASRPGMNAVVRKTLHTTGVAESRLHDTVGDLSEWEEAGCSLAYLPSIHGVRLRLTATAADPREAGDLLGRFESFVREHAGRHLYGEGDDTLEAVVGQMLLDREWTVGTAESCTGGLVSSRLTDIAGASRYVAGGIVAYDNAVKRAALGVSEETLESVGAVSREVVLEMAEGIRRALGVDVGLATSGIMGPAGGSEEKPVGTAWMAAVTPDRARALKVVLRHDRIDNKSRTATTALDLLRRTMLKDV